MILSKENNLKMAHILLVDHYKDFCEILTYSLQNNGYTIATATNEKKAIEQFDKQVPDLILLDSMLPNVHNMKFCWQLRSFSKAPILVLSLADQSINNSWKIAAKVDDYIIKPFEIKELLERMQLLLSGGYLNPYRYKYPKIKMADSIHRKNLKFNGLETAFSLA